jgi:hypothetical protein
MLTGGEVDAPDGAMAPFDVPALDAGLPTGLVVWLPFDDGTPQNTADVVSGFNASCSAGQCPSVTTGQRGGGFLFDGNDDCIEDVDRGQFGQAQLTIAIWLRQDTSDACSPMAKPTALTSTSNTWQIETTTQNQVNFTTSHGSNANVRTTAADNTITIGTWHHVAATFDGATKRLYVDGVQVGTNAISTALTYSTQSVYLGCDNNGGSPAMRFGGALDDFQLYNRALSLAEIQMLAAM